MWATFGLSSFVEKYMALIYPSGCVPRTPNSLNASRNPAIPIQEHQQCSPPIQYNPCRVSTATSSLQSYVDVDAWHSPLPSSKKAPHPSQPNTSPFRFVCYPSLHFLQSSSCQGRGRFVDSRDKKCAIPDDSIWTRCRPIRSIRKSTRQWRSKVLGIEPVAVHIKKALVSP